MCDFNYKESNIVTVENTLVDLPASSYTIILNAEDGHAYRLGTLSLENSGANTAVVNLIARSKTGVEFKLLNISLASAAISMQLLDKLISRIVSLELLITVGTPPTTLKYYLDIIDYTL